MPFLDELDLPEIGPAFVSRLPTPEGALISPIGGIWEPFGWAEGMLENGTLLAGHLGQRIARSSGWQTSNVAALGDVLGDGERVLLSEIGEHVLDLAGTLESVLDLVDPLRAQLSEVLAQLQAAISTVIAGVQSVPIVGWIVAFARLGYTNYQIATSRNLPQALAHPKVYSSAFDELNAQRVIEVLGARDWTSIWTPAPTGWGKISLAYSATGKIDGWGFGPGISPAMLEGTPETEAIAAMPGIVGNGRYFQGRVGTFVNRGTEKAPRWEIQGRPIGIPSENLVTIAPSAALIAAQAWAKLQEPTGACCNVDLDAVRDAWEAWVVAGRTFSIGLPTGHVLDDTLRKMVSAALGDQPTGLYPRPGDVSTLIRDELAELHEQILRLLGTIAVAYVPPNAPALKDRRLKSKHAAMRAKLLEHSARYDVEIDLVDGGDLGSPYRAAIVARTMTPEGIGLATPGAAGAPRRAPLDQGPAPRRPKLPGLPGGASSAGGGGVAILALAAVGLAAMRRRRRRRRTG